MFHLNIVSEYKLMKISLLFEAHYFFYLVTVMPLVLVIAVMRIDKNELIKNSAEDMKIIFYHTINGEPENSLFT